jgi:hypothetical protein
MNKAGKPWEVSFDTEANELVLRSGEQLMRFDAHTGRLYP